MNSYLDARYDLVCRIVQLFIEYYLPFLQSLRDANPNETFEVDYSEFTSMYSKEIDDIIKDFINAKD